MRAADHGAGVYHRAMTPRHARPDPAALRRAAWVQRLTTALGLGLLGLQVARARPFLTDDTFISLRYAARLLDDKGLTWTDGEVVEGYSNLLWVILMAVAGLVGLPLQQSGAIPAPRGGGPGPPLRGRPDRRRAARPAPRGPLG